MLSSVPRVFPLLGLCGGYLLVLFFNPVRLALRDGFRCLLRFKRIWVTFVLLGFAYSVFQFTTFTPLHDSSEFDLAAMGSIATWNWPRLAEVWQDAALPAVEGVAGIFDNATTTYPLSIIAAILLLCNWRGLHGAFLRALGQRFRLWGYLIYLVVVLSAIASLFKPIIYWRLPVWRLVLPDSVLFQTSATVDAVAFIFEYLFGVYIQVYLITVCLAWIKGLSFTEGGLFQFAMRRFTYVLKWAGLVVLISTLIVRLPLLLAYFMNVPDVLDYLPYERVLMAALIILFCSVQVSLVLHNESLREAFRAHRQFVMRNCGPPRLVPAHLRAAFFLAHGLRRDRPWRGRGSGGGNSHLEDDLRLSPRTGHRLAAGLLGLFVPAMRNRADRPGDLDKILR